MSELLTKRGRRDPAWWNAGNSLRGYTRLMVVPPVYTSDELYQSTQFEPLGKAEQ